MSNIHEVNVTDENLYLELWQYDAGQKLKFVETSIADGSHVLFANSETRKAIRKEVANNEVRIPNKFLRATGKMHITIETFNENEETTLYEINGYIKRRQDGEPGTSPEDEPTFIQKIIQKTIELAQSVRDDADNGEFDGFSPQVTVKTETPSTYVLHIKDADHEFDTPNLQGQGEGGTADYEELENKPKINNIELIGNKTTSDLGLDITTGDGLKRVGNVVSVDLKDGESVLGFSNGKLKSDLSAYYTKSETNAITQALANNVSLSIDDNTFLVTVALKHNDTVLATYTTDLYISDLFQNIDNCFTALSNKQDLLDFSNGLELDDTVSPNLLSVSIDDVNGYLRFNGNGKLQVDAGEIARFSAFRSELTNDSYANPLQAEITSQNKLDADLVDDTNSSNKFVSSTDKQTWNAKADTTDIPTNVSELTNDSGYQTSSDVASAIANKEDNTTISTDTSSTTVSLTLADNHEYRYTQELSSLTLTMPNGDFISSIVFASGSTPTAMTYDSSIKWSGDDVTNGQFVPSASKDYDIMMYYNGLNINGIVRGV